MARLTVEDCLKYVDNRFELVLEASKRARRLERGAEAWVPWENDKPTVVSLREIAEGLGKGPKIEKEVLAEEIVTEEIVTEEIVTEEVVAVEAESVDVE